MLVNWKTTNFSSCSDWFSITEKQGIVRKDEKCSKSQEKIKKKKNLKPDFLIIKLSQSQVNVSDLRGKKKRNHESFFNSYCFTAVSQVQVSIGLGFHSCRLGLD